MPLFEILRKTKDHWRPLVGFMDEQGNVVAEPQFTRTSRRDLGITTDAGYAIVERPGVREHLVIGPRGETVLELPKNHISSWFIPPDEHGIFGVTHQVDADNQDLWRSDGRDLVFQGTTHHYAMRLDGTVAFDAHINASAQGHYVFAESAGINRKQGLMDHNGRVKIPPTYKSIYLSRTDPYATVIMDGHANVLRFDGSPVFPQAFELGRPHYFGSVVDGLWIVTNLKKGRADVYDIASTEVVGHLPMSQSSSSYPASCPTLSGGVVCINDPKKGSTYYRPDGRPAMPGILGRPRWFHPDMRTGYFYDGRACFKLGELWGYLDLEGKHAIPPQFNSNLSFKNGLARVKYPADGNSWDRYSYVDREGNVVWHQED